ncbi:MAG: right-handed parallel beta-helix repeat-containing protein [Verrucomicrobiota bacterium]|nr:right-handed parallel beta-helix repeat-containing protein [Verrucomicrobiota bacterium]
MKTFLRFGALVCAFLFGSALSIFAQGSLTPPAAPMPMMKALDQIASTGIALNDVNTPGDTNYHFIINNAGNYYLTGNLAVTKTNGIHVTAAGVTIELNGFQITRGSGSGGDAITIDPLGHRCTVKNGSIRGFDSGINCVFSSGVARAGSFRQLAVYNCATVGLRAGDEWQMEGCAAHDNGTGFVCSGGDTLTNCTASHNSFSGFSDGEGSSLSNCTARSNGSGSGFNFFSNSTFTNCSATRNSTGFGLSDGCALVGCVAAFNSGSGIDLSSSSGSVTSCIARSNGTGTSGFGIVAGPGTTVKDCTAIDNKNSGIRAESGCVILNNTAKNNGSGIAAGIEVTGQKNRIEGNSAIDNQIGFKVESDGNLIIRNSNRGGGGTAFSIAAGNSEGEEINVYNPATTTTITTSNPWVNFLY